MFRLFECCALSFFERFVLSFSLKIERFVSDSAEIWICGLYMWRITGFLFFNDKDYFVDKTKKAFCKERLISFLQEKGIALFDTASAIRRLQDNASDKFLEVVQPTDVPALLHRIPQCKAIVTTGEKATDTLCTQFSIDKPKVGDFTEFLFENHPMRLYRMPSSSRAYPLALEKKAAAYRIMYQDLQML